MTYYIHISIHIIEHPEVRSTTLAMCVELVCQLRKSGVLDEFLCTEVTESQPLR